MKESHLPRIELKTSGIQTEVFIDGRSEEHTSELQSQR